MASGISMHASPLAGSVGRRAAPAVSCSPRPSLPQVGLCFLGRKGQGSRRSPAPLSLHKHFHALMDPAPEEEAWSAAGKGRA